MPDININVNVIPTGAVTGTAQVNAALDTTKAKVVQTTDELTKMAKAYVAARMLAELRELSDGFTEVQNRIRTVTSSEDEMVDISNRLFEVAQRTRTSWGETAATFQRVTQATRELGLSQQEVIDFTRQLNEAFIISGVSAGEQTRVTRDLLHGLDQGTLAWRQLLPIMSQAPSVARIIAEHFHVATGELHELAKSGQITGRAIVDAFTEANDSLEAGFGKTVPTIAQMMTTLKNAAEKFLGELMHGSIVVGVLGTALGFLVEHFDTVGKVLVVLADVLIVKWAMTAIPAAIAATESFTAALMANPLFWGVALVSAILLFREQLVRAFTAVKEWIEGIPILGDLLRVFEGALGGLADLAGLVGSAFGLLKEAVGDVYDAVSDFMSLPMPEALEEQRRAVVAQSLALVQLWQATRDTVQMARALEGVDIVRRTTDLIAAITLAVQLQREVQIAQVAAAKVFGADLVAATAKAAKAAEDAKRAAQEWARATEALKGRIDELRASLSPTESAAQQLAETIGLVTAAEQRHLITTAEGTRLIQQRTIAIAAQQIAADESIARQSADVGDLLKAEERRLELAKLLAAAAPGNRGPDPAPDQSTGRIHELQDRLAELAHTANTTVVDAFHSVAQAIVEMATAGKFNWRTLTESVLADLERMIVRMIEMKLLAAAIGILSGGAGGAATGAIDYFASSSAGTPIYGGGHADGAPYRVPGAGGADSVPVLFRLTPGEDVFFRPPGANGPVGGSGGAPPTVNISNQVVIDPGFVPSVMASPAGHRAMMEFVRLNARQIAQLTNG